ncbi:MAG: hypothetical protein K1X82_04865 [Bacteroidia bacterium]|nr:hypothetical protein [Bacteroidia bacterium]
MLTREEAIQICIHSLEEKIKFIQNQLNELSQGIENDGKSSAGDKHETSISMMQLEQEKLGEQLFLTLDQHANLLKLTNQEFLPIACNGRLILTSNGYYFLGVSLGKVTTTAGTTFFALSIQSPFGKLLVGKKMGESFQFNGKNYQILNIE